MNIQTQQKYQLTLDNIPYITWLIDSCGIIQIANKAFLTLYKCSEADIIGKNYCDFLNKETANRFIEENKKVMLTASTLTIEHFFEKRVAGKAEIHWMETTLTPVYSEDTPEQCLGVIGIGRNITQRKRAEQQLYLANKVIESSSEAILITDCKNRIIRVNPAFQQLTGYEEIEVLGRNPSLLKSGHHPKAFYQAMWDKLLSKHCWQGEVWDRRKDGTTYPKWMTISIIDKNANGDGVGKYLALFSDLTERKAAESQISYMVYHDALTGLANRTLFEERLTHVISEAEEDEDYIALLVMDLDHFKHINDSMGHYIGDQLLVEVSKRLQTCLRRNDFLARLGGDEFVIMLNKPTHRNNVETLAKKILDLFKQPFEVLNYSLHITLSIGISLYPEHGGNHELLLQSADTAMFYSKKAGRNHYSFFVKEMNQAVQHRLQLEYRLRASLARNSFVLHYQPQVNLAEHKIVGVEALIRWPHESGMISPTEFIPVAEETGLIVPLGEWVLKTACQDCKRWHEQGFPITVAVNLSARQFVPGYLIALVKESLSESGLEAHYLELEITEGTLMNNSASSASNLLNELKAIGVKLSIDDFGTGYSSLAYLKAFNVDKLKIDRAFVSHLPNSPDDVAIACAIIQLAKSLNLNIVAEGAETLENIEFLHSHGCDQVQGYYFAKPMPGDKLLEFMKNW